MPDAPADPVAARLAEMRRNSRWTSSADEIAEPGANAVKSARDVPALLAAVEAALALAGKWQQESDDMREQSVRDGLHPALAGAHREANRIRFLATELSRAISAALTGEGDTDA